MPLPFADGDISDSSGTRIARDSTEQTHKSFLERGIEFTLGIAWHGVNELLHVKPQVIAAKAFQSKWAEVERVERPQVMFYEFNAQNIGHFLTDILMPVYSILESFGAIDRIGREIELMQVHVTSPQNNKEELAFSCEWQIANMAYNAKETCEHFYRTLSFMMTRHAIQQMPVALKASKTADRAVCYNELFVGMMSLSDTCEDHSHGRGHDAMIELCAIARQKQFWDYRRYTKRAAMQVANGGKLPDDWDVRPKQQHVVLWVGNGKRKVEDLNPWAKKIADHFPEAKVTMVDWATMDITEQLKVIGSATVYISCAGAGSFISLYLPRGATAIRLYSDTMDEGTGEKGKLIEWNLFSYLGHIQARYMVLQGGKIKEPELFRTIANAFVRWNAFDRLWVPPEAPPEGPTDHIGRYKSQFNDGRPPPSTAPCPSDSGPC